MNSRRYESGGAFFERAVAFSFVIFVVSVAIIGYIFGSALFRVCAQ